MINVVTEMITVCTTMKITEMKILVDYRNTQTMMKPMRTRKSLKMSRCFRICALV